MDTAEIFNHVRKTTMAEIEDAIGKIDAKMAAELVSEILRSRKVFCVGVGRVMLALQAFTKRLAHLGIDAHFVGEITEPAIKLGDLLIVGSGSGESLFPLTIAKKAKSLGVNIAHIGSNPNGSMAQYSDIMIRIPVRTKLALADEVNSEQPMTSLFEQSLLVLGDIIAQVIIKEKGLDMRSLWLFHANLE